MANNTSEAQQLQIHQFLPVKVLVVGLYVLILLVSIFGNCLVIFVVASNRLMQTVTNLFITNLAVSDLTQTLTCVWATPAYAYTEEWKFGAFTCYMVTAMQGMSIFISSFTLTAIALDRYVVIMHPFRRRISVCQCLGIMFLIWLLALALTLPTILKLETIESETGMETCLDEWENSNMRRLYGMTVMVIQYGVTFAVTAFCYIRIVKHLRVSTMHMMKARSAERQAAEAKKKQKLNQMLILMVIIFGCTWFSYHCVNNIRDFNPEIGEKIWFALVFLLAHIVAMTSTMWNPILYAWKNENFKREFMAVLPCFPWKRVPRRRSNNNKFPSGLIYDVVPVNQQQNRNLRVENVRMNLLSPTSSELL